MHFKHLTNCLLNLTHLPLCGQSDRLNQRAYSSTSKEETVRMR